MSSKTGASGFERGSRRRTWSLAGRLTAVYATAAFALVLVSTLLIHWSLVRSLAEEDDQFLSERAHVLARLVNEHSAKSVELRWEVESEWQGFQAPVSYVRILQPNGQTLVETPGMATELPRELFPAAVPISEEVKQGVDLQSRGGQLVRVLTVAVGQPNGGEQIIQIAMDRTSDEDVVGRSSRVLVLVLTIAMLVSLFASYQIAHRGMRPVNAMAETAATVRTGTLGERLPIEGLPSELGALAATFNEMLGRLEESFNRLSRFSADIAHELRTPLNNLRGEAEVALRTGRSREDVLNSSLEEYDRLSRIIDSLLFLARAESPEMQLKRERLDVCQELQAIKEFYDAAAQEKSVGIRVEAHAPVIAELDRTLLQRALGNLVSNALAHTPGKGLIVLRAVSEPEVIRVEVADNGTGIAQEHISRIFERFYRADGARSRISGGVGLGLAIVRSIAVVHGGSAGIQSEPGRGTTVSLTFPKMTKS